MDKFPWGEISDEEFFTEWIRRVGDDPTRQGLIDTPKRIAKAVKQIYRGYYDEVPKLTAFDNGSDGLKYDQMIGDNGYFYSSCEHHGEPFFGRYWFAYIPDQKIVGLSKIARVIKHYSGKLQIQERIAKEVCDYIESEIKPKGIALVLKARHMCKERRGVEQYGGVMTTNEVRGVFRENQTTKAEFLELITKNNEW